MRTLPLLSVMTMLCIATAGGAAEAAERTGAPQSETEVQVPAGVYTPPKAIKLHRAMDIPFREIIRGREGWVQFNMMIDPDGRPYEIAIVDSSGSEEYEKVALEAIERTRWEPATFDGKPIHSAYAVKFRFEVSGQRGARREFSTAYRRMLKAVEAGDRQWADEWLAKLEPFTLYEAAFRNFARYAYYRKWGTEEEQRDALLAAIAHETGPTYLDRKTFIDAYSAAMGYELKASRYGRALEMWEHLQKLGAEKVIEQWQPLMDQVIALRESNQSVFQTERITKGTSWYGTLFRNRFTIQVESGRVAEIKLRCETKYLLFPFEPDIEYRVGGANESCNIEVVGDPETTFKLIHL